MIKTQGIQLSTNTIKSIITAGILSVIIFLIVGFSGGFIINPESVIPEVYIAINSVCFVLCWLTLHVLLSKFSIYKILGVLGLLCLSAIAEYYFQIPNNPISIPALILFWMGISYFVIPQFFKKYQILILLSYGGVITYFFIFRGKPNYAEDYSFVITGYFILSISMMILLWGYYQWKWYMNLKVNQTQNELILLKSQINPHFFFNTLNNLYGLVIEKSDQAPEMILKLSDIMRYTIYEGKSDFVDLEEEIKYIEDYIELSKIRYNKKVDISFKMEIEIPQKIAPILLVIPIENAFKHGIDSLTENAFLEIEIKTGKSYIFFSVKNNYASTNTNHKGIGLDNLKQRLAIMYPNKHKLNINTTNNKYELSLYIETL
ncbi:Histidine kinase [Tenacibaculum sp. 190524A05c]|uniref:sensor histidine kinase n=1 Tax=Tenacibaculum platacis TaxID=3137852 RepID=UPI0031FAFAE8